MNYTPDEMARMVFNCMRLTEPGEQAFLVQFAHKHMYLFCGTASY